MTSLSAPALARFPHAIAKVGGVGLLIFGVWAMVGPRSFFDELATFDPYNQHLIQDIGAFQIGLGAVLLLAAIPVNPDALAVALLGVGVGMVAHVVSHVVGNDLGGTPAIDIPAFVIFGGLLLFGGSVRWSAAAADKSQ